MVKKNIALRVKEIADFYAMETFYHELKQTFPNKNIYFNYPRHSNDIIKKMVEKYPFNDCLKDVDLLIIPYSDITSECLEFYKGPNNTFSIDIAILKACRKLPTPSKEKELREEFGFSDLEKPLVVLGNASNYDYTKKIITELSDHAHIAVVPDMADMVDSLRLDKKTKSQVTEFPGKGKLAKLYAIADLAISGSNLRKLNSYLHNFYEQTQGGPVFLVPTTLTCQYGFKKFVKQEMIHLCDDLDDLIEKSKDYLQKPRDKQKHRRKWLAHRNETRKKILPEVFVKMLEIMNSKSSLKKVSIYRHPESFWG